MFLSMFLSIANQYSVRGKHSDNFQLLNLCPLLQISSYSCISFITQVVLCRLDQIMEFTNVDLDDEWDRCSSISSDSDDG